MNMQTFFILYPFVFVCCFVVVVVFWGVVFFIVFISLDKCAHFIILIGIRLQKFL